MGEIHLLAEMGRRDESGFQLQRGEAEATVEHRLEACRDSPCLACTGRVLARARAAREDRGRIGLHSGYLSMGPAIDGHIPWSALLSGGLALRHLQGGRRLPLWEYVDPGSHGPRIAGRGVGRGEMTLRQ